MPPQNVAETLARALETPGLNHRFDVAGGVREETARELIQQFFREKRRV